MLLVSDIMTKNPEYFHPKDLASKARSVMREHRYRSFPVVEDDKVVGIITRGDIMRVTSNRTNLLVEGIMSKNVDTITKDKDIIECGAEMLKAGVNQLPVIENDKLVGIVCAHDILAALIEANRKPKKNSVSEIMTTEVIYCNPEDEISNILDKMQASGYSGFPVVSKKKVIGMITRLDIIRVGSARLSKESGKNRVVYVKKAMKTPAITIKQDASVKDAAELMIKNKIIRIPVVDKHNNLVGIIDIEDVMRTYLS